MIEIMKKIACEKMLEGATAMQVAEWIAKDLGTDVARLVFAAIALDQGNEAAARGLVANVTK